MNKITLILSALLTLTLLVFIAPSIIAMNRGKMLRNVALWLAIALGLALVYQTFGPGKSQNFSVPAANDSSDESLPGNNSVPDSDQGYTPPKE